MVATRKQNTLSSKDQHNLLTVLPGNAQNIGKRHEQQDSFGFLDINDSELISRAGFLAVVADGMGGLAMGREASTLAVETIISEYSAKSSEETIAEALTNAVTQANANIFAMARQAGLAGDVGTTTVAVVIHEGYLHWISVGDSRIFLFRDGQLTQLTTDHTYANELAEKVARGIISQEAADTHPERAALTSFLGLETISHICRSDSPFKLEQGDRVLLCSDGLYNSLSETEIVENMNEAPQKAADILVKRVLEKEYRYQDNVTVAILGYGISIQPTVSNPEVRPKLRNKKKPLWMILVLGILISGLVFAWQKYGENHSPKQEQQDPQVEPAPVQPDSQQKPGMNNSDPKDDKKNPDKPLEKSV